VRAAGSSRAEQQNWAEPSAGKRAPPGSQQLVEAAGGLIGQLDLDRFGRIAEEDQVGPVIAAAAARREMTELLPTMLGDPNDPCSPLRDVVCGGSELPPDRSSVRLNM
jgi:hypothetical protein